MYKNNLKVMIVEPSGKGGICHYTYNLCYHLGYMANVHLLTSVHYELKDFDRNFFVYEFLNKFRTTPKNYIKALKLVLAYFKTIHIQVSQYPFVIASLIILLKIFKKKIIVTAHNILPHDCNKISKFTFHVIYRLSKKIIVHAYVNKYELESIFSINQNKIEVIPHGNYTFFKRPENKEISYINKPNCILFFGYIRRYKGLKYLLRAMPKVIQEIPDAQLIIAGNPVEEFNSYNNEIIKLGLQKNIIKDLGYISFERVSDYFARAKIVALPYEKIYQSGVVQLAYAYGIPIVAFNVGGLSEVVFDAISGYLVEPQNVDMLAIKIIKILKDDYLATKMSNNAHELSERIFSWDKIARKTNMVYKAINNE